MTLLGQHRSGSSKFQGVYAYGRYDDNPMALDEGENLLLQEIRKYFMLKWSRHFKKFDDHNLMNRVQYMIARQIRDEVLPDKLNLAYFIPPSTMCSNRPIATVYLEAHIMSVGRYLQEKMAQPGEFRRAAHGKRIKDRIAHRVDQLKELAGVRA